MPDIQTQNKMILEHLKVHGSIIGPQAVELFGCYRLSARIYDLKAAGYKITSIRMYGINRFGARTQFARYTLDNKNKEVPSNG